MLLFERGYLLIKYDKIYQNSKRIIKTFDEDLKDISIGTCVFMGLPVEDYESFDSRFSICNGYLLCLYESELCTQAEYNVLMNTLREIYELKTGDKGLFYNGDDETIKDAQFPETLLKRH